MLVILIITNFKIYILSSILFRELTQQSINQYNSSIRIFQSIDTSRLATALAAVVVMCSAKQSGNGSNTTHRLTDRLTDWI